MKIILRPTLFLFILFFLPAVPSSAQRSLTPQQIERVKTSKQLIEEVDSKSLQRTIDELEESRYPDLNLQIMEVIVRTYADIVKENNVVGLKNKQWLYSMIALNMANLQFGGNVGKGGRDTSLNSLITHKLKKYLPEEAMHHPGFSKSVE